MDKFGIFNVLNSFLNGFAGNNREEAASAEKSPDEQKPRKDGSSADRAKPIAPPLQSSMLNVLNSHDAFIRRVREKNGKN